MLKSLSVMQVIDKFAVGGWIMPFETIIKGCASWDDNLTR